MTENPKYRLTDETIVFDDKTLYRIEAVRDFGNVISGTLGGFVETEDNLSHDGNCWLSDWSKALGSARIRGNAQVAGRSVVRDSAVIDDDVWIDDCDISAAAKICGKSVVVDTSVSGCAYICTTSYVRHATVSGFANILENAGMYTGTLTGSACLDGNAEVVDDAVVSGDVRITDIRVRSAVSRNPIVIEGFRYRVVVTDDYVSIGCQRHPFKFWTKGLFPWMTKGYFVLRNHSVRHRDAVRMIRALRAITAIHGDKVRNAQKRFKAASLN